MVNKNAGERLPSAIEDLLKLSAGGTLSAVVVNRESLPHQWFFHRKTTLIARQSGAEMVVTLGGEATPGRRRTYRKKPYFRENDCVWPSGRAKWKTRPEQNVVFTLKPGKS
jgi:hypothetical protein